MLAMGLVSSATADCIDAHTRNEFARIGQPTVGVEVWRSTVWSECSAYASNGRSTFASTSKR